MESGADSPLPAGSRGVELGETERSRLPVQPQALSVQRMRYWAQLIFACPLMWSLLACDACEVEPLGDVPQPGAISGRVCDPSAAQDGIYGARVYVVVEVTADSTREITTVTDSEGNFLLEGVPAGTYTVYVERGSFRTELPEVTVEEELTTELDTDACLAPTTVTMTVFEGHDSVEEVLERLGYLDYTMVPTFYRPQDRDDTTPSWIVEAFYRYEDFAANDILFINCGAHEWALDRATEEELAIAFENLRRFVVEGGSIYLSDWSYDLLEALYPDAVDWMGADALYNDAEHGLAQFFVGEVLDTEIAAVLGLDRASLRYEQNRIAIPETLGEGANALIVADIEVEDIDGQSLELLDVPVLFEFRPPVLTPNAQPGRIIYTTFHNGSSNTPDMDEVLRAIIFAL